ncbi:GTP pyrophosphokinase [Pantoea allii]|uniref:GTP pyrophosphokinase n=1 Tax=Pantoea allii TaxID=574096 RepID=UPI001F4D8798|nr:RelA/SpoT domain-containing protein [Pantoea allii]MCH9300402.1 RelA/SpoT domain-containing protein [Pantoea allii]
MGDVISLFMERYNKEFDFYSNLSKKVEDDLRVKLHSLGVRAIVSSRAKSLKRLRDKIIDRNVAHSYTSVESIYSDIVDLAGVRVALYFPGDMTKVEEIILKEFDIEGEPKEFPEKKRKVKKNTGYEKVFSGYAAKHFRVKMKGAGRYSNNYPVEIQVASVLMHAWSEVEHDLVYKPLQGNLSEEELMILDEINGLVLSGNLALQRLQLAGLKRTESDNYEFKNHYDLALFFISCLQEDNIDSVNFNDIFKLLKLMDKTKRNELSDVVDWIKNNPLNKENTASTNGVRRRRRDPAARLYDYITKAIVTIFPDDAIDILQKCSKDIWGDFEISEKAKETLFKAIKSIYFGSSNYSLIDSITDDYESNNIFIFASKERSLQDTKETKNVSFSISDDEVIMIFDDYLEQKNQLSSDNFSKELLENLIKKNEAIFNIMSKITE